MLELLARSRMVKDAVIASLSTTTATDLNYKEAIRIINSLQSNSKTIEDVRTNRKEIESKTIEQSRKYLERCGVTLDRLDTLSVIHIAGTKGKGSTSAFCESILRHHGYRTGFFSSPHLVSVRERVRVDGRPLSRAAFAAYVHDVYQRLRSQQEHQHDMPPFFKFLSTMAFNVFLEENVDVAIIEVGIGGEYDCTNVLRQVCVVGITSLGLDHTSILGRSIPEIAWQKAGIMKPGSVAFTCQGQPAAAMTVLRSRAAQRECPLLVSPPLESYRWGQHKLILGISGDVQKSNASLALQLANHWLTHHNELNGNVTAMNGLNGKLQPVETAEAFPITWPMAEGLKWCVWPGRTQVLPRGHVTYYLDGAHTIESMQVCADWFRQVRPASPPGNTKRILVFNTTGDRNAPHFLETLFVFDFDLVVFCPNNVHTTQDPASELLNLMVTHAQQMTRCKDNRQVWLTLQASADVRVLPCVGDAIHLIQQLGQQAEVLVTGSLHLVGSVLSVVDPELTGATQHTTQHATLAHNVTRGSV